MKSVKIRQADEAAFVADRAAGLAEHRRAIKHYNQQTDRAVEETVNRWMAGEKREGDDMPKEDDDAVYQDLGDRYQEIHHHNAKQSSALSKALPWIAAAILGMTGLGTGAAGTALLWWLNRDNPAQEEVNVKDVQSAFRVEVYDESGTLIETLPYNKLPQAAE